ncbi:MAG: 5'-methylthioadenosine/S-adenosylhomocysteine nucleosidase [Gammaproteobacteria bacterium]|nr:5'-methylthioadenosine/S-adenosylhomocysteine nucleosidase [Gammaproteobacteria bacterium]
MTKSCFDVGIIAALPEELGYLKEMQNKWESIRFEGTYFYHTELVGLSAVCCLAGQMGTSPAMSMANRLLTFAEVRVLVLVGIAGAIGSDVGIGDVVVADEVNEFQASSKAQSTSNGYEVQYSGRHWPLEFAIKECIRHFQFSCSIGYTNWQSLVTDDYSTIHVPNKANLCSTPTKLHLGPIASGNTVAASSAFLREIRRINRKFIAIDMESAGVAYTASERVQPVPWLVVRGVSDRGDEEKKSLDDFDGVWRRFAFRNALGLLKSLFSWSHFRAACGLCSIETSVNENSITRKLIELVESTTGAAWLVGVAFGLYSHGPFIAETGTLVPLDVSRLRLLDSKIDELIISSIELKESCLATNDLPRVAARFQTLIDEYRHQVCSTKADLLLSDFDHVVREIVCPTSDEQVSLVIEETNRLEEDVGVEAVVEYLKNHWKEDIRFRQRYITALFDSRNWKTIVNTLQDLDSERLAREELEALCLAHAYLSDFHAAADSLQVYVLKHEDAAAKLFSQQLIRQFTELRETDRTRSD